MKLRFLVCLIVITAANIAFSAVTHADSWLPPKPSVTYESADQNTRLIVTHSPQAVSLARSSGALYVKDSEATEWCKLWSRPLPNKISPVSALIANGGWRTITFDEYYAVGYGEAVIVFYNEAGTVFRNYSLESLLSPAELALVPRSVSSRWWRSSAVLDEELGLLKIEVAQRDNGAVGVKRMTFDLVNGDVL